MVENTKDIMIVVPCYNEEETIYKLISELKKVRIKLSNRYKIDVMLINDGSTDKTQPLIDSLSKSNKFLLYRQFSANAGHQSALRAGLEVCGNYEAVVMLDADMQHPPELIPEMITAWENGASIVQMIREDSVSEAGLLKYATSKLYYKIMNSISSLNLEYGASDFRLIDQSITTVQEAEDKTRLL